MQNVECLDIPHFWTNPALSWWSSRFYGSPWVLLDSLFKFHDTNHHGKETVVLERISQLSKVMQVLACGQFYHIINHPFVMKSSTRGGETRTPEFAHIRNIIFQARHGSQVFILHLIISQRHLFIALGPRGSCGPLGSLGSLGSRALRRERTSSDPKSLLYS